jgi:hypothetical protein
MLLLSFFRQTAPDRPFKTLIGGKKGGRKGGRKGVWVL